MNFEEWKQAMRDEWQFWKRHPEFPLMLLLGLSAMIYSLIKEYYE